MIVPDYREFKHSNELYHYGIKGKSGRYPLGSGERPYQDYPNKSHEKINGKNKKSINNSHDKLKKIKNVLLNEDNINKGLSILNQHIFDQQNMINMQNQRIFDQQNMINMQNQQIMNQLMFI